MELQRTTLALRSATSCALRAPSRLPRTQFPHTRLAPSSTPSASLPVRSIQSTSRQAAAQAAAARADDADSSRQQTQPTPARPQPPRPSDQQRPFRRTGGARPRDRSGDAAEIDSILDGALGARTNANNLPRRPSNAAASPRPGAQRLDRSAVSNLPLRSGSAGHGASLANSMRSPNASGLLGPSAPVEQDTSPAPFRISAALGRSIPLGARHGMDLARALAELGSRLAQNRVRSDASRQRFHERPGMKRKRLKSERWRARFKMDFQATVRRVQELTRKGW